MPRGDAAPTSSGTRAAPLPIVRATPLQAGYPPARRRQRRIVVATLVVAHGVAVIGLLNASRLRDAAVDARPIFLAVVDTPAPNAPSRPLPRPPTTPAPPTRPLTLPIIVAEQPPAPSPVAPQALPSPSLSPPPSPSPSPSPSPAAPGDAPPAPAPSIVPRTIAASEIQYIVPATPVYSRISVKMREAGKAVVRVLIDETGLPRNVQLVQSTGFPRLDDATLAAVRTCRFKPHLENGVAVAAWAVLPFEFELPT
jgi:protein TonB